MKLLFIDTETTGTHPKKHGILQIAGIIEIDGEVKEEFNLKCQPFKKDEITDEALKVNGITREEIKTFPSPMETYKTFVNIIGKYIDKYKKGKTLEDKYYLVGQNISFDNSMIEEWFRKCNDNYWYAYKHYGMIDIITITSMLEAVGMYKGANKKLETVAKEFEIEYAAHDALEDIKVTREIFYKYVNYLKPNTVCV